jgi:hypothetical protein
VGHVDLAVFQLLQFFDGQLGCGVGRGADAQGDEDLFQVEADTLFLQDFSF